MNVLLNVVFVTRKSKTKFTCDIRKFTGQGKGIVIGLYRQFADIFD